MNDPRSAATAAAAGARSAVLASFLEAAIIVSSTCCGVMSLGTVAPLLMGRASPVGNASSTRLVMKSGEARYQATGARTSAATTIHHQRLRILRHLPQKGCPSRWRRHVKSLQTVREGSIK